MTRNAWIALLFVLAVAGLWVVTTSDTHQDRPTPSAEEPAAFPEGMGGSVAEPAPPPQAAAQEAQAAEPTDPSAPAQAPAAAPPVTRLPLPEKTGPVDELKARFASEPRDSSAEAIEKEVEAAFRSTDVPPGLLKSVLCRSTVCRVETSWTPERAIGFMSAFTRLLMVPPGADQPPRLFDSNLAVSPEGDAREGDAYSVDVYIARLPPPEPAR